MEDEKGTHRESNRDILAKMQIEEIVEKKFKDLFENEREDILGNIQRGLINRIFGIYEEYENSFIQLGGYWLIKYCGKMGLLKHQNGLSYIAFLLQKKDEDIFNLELLARFPKGETPENKTLQAYKRMKTEKRIDQLEEEGMGAGQLLNFAEKARPNITNRITGALKAIKKCPDISPLEIHLKEAITLGKQLSYRSPISWFVLIK
jgi:hypothetical protein